MLVGVVDEGHAAGEARAEIVADLRPTSRRVPPVMYSQPFEPQPSITAVAPELRTANRSPAWPAANRKPAVAPYSTVLPMMVLSWLAKVEDGAGRTTMVAPDRPLPT